MHLNKPPSCTESPVAVTQSLPACSLWLTTRTPCKVSSFTRWMLAPLLTCHHVSDREAHALPTMMLSCCCWLLLSLLSWATNSTNQDQRHHAQAHNNDCHNHNMHHDCQDQRENHALTDRKQPGMENDGQRRWDFRHPSRTQNGFKTAFKHQLKLTGVVSRADSESPSHKLKICAPSPVSSTTTNSWGSCNIDPASRGSNKVALAFSFVDFEH